MLVLLFRSPLHTKFTNHFLRLFHATTTTTTAAARAAAAKAQTQADTQAGECSSRRRRTGNDGDALISGRRPKATNELLLPRQAAVAAAAAAVPLPLPLPMPSTGCRRCTEFVCRFLRLAALPLPSLPRLACRKIKIRKFGRAASALCLGIKVSQLSWRCRCKMLFPRGRTQCHCYCHLTVPRGPIQFVSKIIIPLSWITKSRSQPI